MKRITFRADEELIEAARARARAEHTTLSREFGVWFKAYTLRGVRTQPYDEGLDREGDANVGYKLPRDEADER